jgi:hypothetical protein
LRNFPFRELDMSHIERPPGEAGLSQRTGRSGRGNMGTVALIIKSEQRFI